MDCNHDGCDHKHIVDHKHTIVVVDHNDDHRKQTFDALLSFYNILEFRNTNGLLDSLHKIRPAILLIDEAVPSHGAFELVRLLRLNPRTRRLPVIILLSSDSRQNILAASECGADGWLVKPVLRSDIIRKISDLLNSTVEEEWQKLPAVQFKALKGTVEVFNKLADSIANGEPIIYDDVGKACDPLIEAVNSDNFMGILNGVKNHDNYTYVHSLRVATMLSLFGHAIQLPVHEQKILTTGGLLHDIGKMYIPHNILNKPGKLDSSEFEVMKSHVTQTIKCLEKNDDLPNGIVTIAGQHHEKLDGTGYPFGLEGSKLNDLARMAAIVDIFSALTDRRVYKAPMAPEDALSVMINEMSRHIDIDLLGLFRQRFLDSLRTFD